MKYIIVKTEQALKQTQKLTLQTIPSINTMRMGDADLRFHISTMQGWHKSAFLTRAWFPRAIHLIMQYIKPFTERSCCRIFIETWPHSDRMTCDKCYKFLKKHSIKVDVCGLNPGNGHLNYLKAPFLNVLKRPTCIGTEKGRTYLLCSVLFYYILFHSWQTGTAMTIAMPAIHNIIWK